MKPSARVRNPEALALLGQQLRRTREAAALSQSRVSNMRQGTVSKMENGLDVTLDTFLSYAAALGLEIALVPIGQAILLQPKPSTADRDTAASLSMDLLTEFDHLRNP